MHEIEVYDTVLNESTKGIMELIVVKFTLIVGWLMSLCTWFIVYLSVVCKLAVK